MRVKKEKVKQLILEFQKNLDIDVLKQIIKEISDMVYNYPTLVFHVNPEECSDFYIYIIERLKPLILKYNTELSSFYTWFNVVLKSQCLNWLNSIQAKKRKSFQTESLDTGHQYMLSDTSGDTHEDDNITAVIKQYIAELPDLDRLIIKLLYYDINNKLVNEISMYNKRPVKENLEMIKHFLNNNKKFKIYSELTSKISVLQYKILDLKKRLLSSDDEEKDKLKIRVKTCSSTLRVLKETFNHNLENFDIHSIAGLLNINQRETYYRLRKIKDMLYIKLKEKIKL